MRVRVYVCMCKLNDEKSTTDANHGIGKRVEKLYRFSHEYTRERARDIALSYTKWYFFTVW